MLVRVVSDDLGWILLTTTVGSGSAKSRLLPVRYAGSLRLHGHAARLKGTGSHNSSLRGAGCPLQKCMYMADHRSRCRADAAQDHTLLS